VIVCACAAQAVNTISSGERIWCSLREHMQLLIGIAPAQVKKLLQTPWHRCALLR
jgi:hypothetical protein